MTDADHRMLLLLSEAVRALIYCAQNGIDATRPELKRLDGEITVLRRDLHSERIQRTNARNRAQAMKDRAKAIEEGSTL